MISAGMIEHNLPRHTQLDQMRQIFAYSSLQSQNGPTCSSLKFHGVAKYIVPDFYKTYEIIGAYGPMLEIKSHNENKKRIILNLVSKAFKDGTIVVLHMPWTVSLHLDIAMLPSMIRSIYGHFLEQEGIPRSCCILNAIKPTD